MRGKRSTGPVVRAAWAAALSLVSALTVPAAAQDVTVQAKGVRIGDVADLLAEQTGYRFSVAAGKQIEDARKDVSIAGKPLAATLSLLSSVFNCDFYSPDSGGFFVIPLPKAPEKEATVGAYRLRVERLAETQEGALELTLGFTSDDDERIEAIAGLGPELKIIDNFGRALTAPRVSGIRRTTGIRSRLTSYWHRQYLYPVDDRAVRIRSISGTLVLFKKVTPLRLEFPLEDPDRARALVREGVDVRLERFSQLGRDCFVATRLAWPSALNVVGRGISRTPLPYLVDERGRAHRDASPRLVQSRPEEGAAGENLSEQQFRFEGVEAKPVKLVYDILLREQPEGVLPFRLGDIPLPARDPAAEPPQERPFAEAAGGSLSFLIRDRSGRPAEGEVSVGISRKTATGWTGWRWTDLITDPDGRARLGPLQPGVYRITRVYRTAPGTVPVSRDSKPLEVTVAAKKDAEVAPLRLPITVSEP